MDIWVLDRDFKAIKVLDTYKSFIWTDRYYAYGDFELYLPMNDEILEYMQQDYYLRCNDSEHLMIIEKIQIASNSEDGDYITVTGRSLESILDRRIVWQQKTVSGTLQDGIEELLDDCIISPDDSDRQISNFIFEASDDENITGLSLTAQYTGDNLYDTIKSICEDESIGFKIVLNDDLQFVFSLYFGTDRSYEQTENPYVIFSPNFENIINSNYIESKSAYKTVSLIGGEGEGSERVYSTVSVDDSTGLDRRELFTDARDISSEVDGETISDEEYEAELQQRGYEDLAENVEVVSFEGEMETTQSFKLNEDFFIGDVVQVEDSYGHTTQARVLELVMSYDTDGVSVYPTFATI